MYLCSSPLQLKQSYASWGRRYPKLNTRMKMAWAPCASKWAFLGRLDVLDMGANTNNPCQRQMGLLKYMDANRNTQFTINELVDCC
jgi:hypothetical protein